MRINCSQYSEEWWLVRKGRFTASDAHTIAVAGAGLITLAWEKAAEKIMSDEQYFNVLARRKSNIVLDFASAQENFSREWLSAKLGKEIEDGGVEIFDDNTAFSADGFIGGIDGLEIKNHEPRFALRMFHTLQKGLREAEPNWAKIIDPLHYDQMQFALWKNGGDFWTFALGSDCWDDAVHFWKIPSDIERQKIIAAGVEKGNALIANIVLDLYELDKEYHHASTSNF